MMNTVKQLSKLSYSVVTSARFIEYICSVIAEAYYSCGTDDC